MSDSDDDYYGPPPPAPVRDNSKFPQTSSSTSRKTEASASSGYKRDDTRKDERSKIKRHRSTSSSSSRSSDDDRDRRKRKHQKPEVAVEAEKPRRPFTYTKTDTSSSMPNKLPADIEDIREVPHDYETLLEDRRYQKSLLDMHREEQRSASAKAKAANVSGSSSNSASERLPFDRERDFGGKGGNGRPKMDYASRQSFIAQNQGALSSSFAHGKRKFL